MIGPGTVWALLGLPGLREILVVAVVTLLLYGRSGLMMHRRFQVLRPWLSPARREPSKPRSAPARRKIGAWPGLGDRVFWALALTAAAAVAAWIATRTIILAPSSPPR
jgi:hypothetical protein